MYIDREPPNNGHSADGGRLRCAADLANKSSRLASGSVRVFNIELVGEQERTGCGLLEVLELD